MMQLLVIVLNKLECLDKLLTALEEEHIPGATILDSRGMAQQLEGHDELRFLGSLRMLMNPCLLYTSPSPRDLSTSRMPSSA